MRLDRVTVVVKRCGYESGARFSLVGVAEATNQGDGLAEEVFRRLRGSRLHQFQFERELDPSAPRPGPRECSVRRGRGNRAP